MDASDCPGCRERDARIADLEARILALEGQVRDLLDKLKPPTPPKLVTPQPPPPGKKPTGRKPGGQPGHKPYLKQFLPQDRVQNTIPYIPKQCSKCQQPLPETAGPNDPEPTRFQVVELPKVLAEVTEHQGHSRTCSCCNTVTTASVPAAIRDTSIGTRFTSVMTYLVSVQGVSKRGVEEIAETIFGAPISLGTIANLEQEMSAALASAHEEARAAIATAGVKHVDETGWKEAGKKRWLWVSATASIAYFLIHPRRNLDALKRVVGSTLGGILCSDRWRVYEQWPGLRQLCWAHVKRNWEKQAERGGKEVHGIAEAWLDGQKRVFVLWHRYRAGGCTRVEMKEGQAALFLELAEVLRRGRESGDSKFARFCMRLDERFGGLWTFVMVEGVDPTNNQAERVLRRPVIWRRRSFGCHSAAGCRFVERCLTVVQTLRLQGRSVLDFLTETIDAHRQGLKYPKLLSTA
jgi:transposase